MFGGSQDDKIVKTIINGDELIVLGTTKSGDYSSHDYNIPDGEDILEQDIFISRYSIKYSDRKHLSTTFLGGTNFDEITDAAISRDGSKLYIVGNTNSNDFPYLGTQHASVRGDLDGFFTKFDIETMAMEFSSIYGGSAKDSLTGIAVNQQGDFYIIGTTSSTNISLKSAAQTFVAGGTDMCFAKFWSDGVNPYFSTYIGGNEDDRANAIALSDDSYHIYIAGSTRSSNFEIIPKWDYYGKIFDRKHNGGKDGLLLVYKDGQPKFSYSCFFGGDGDDEIMDIAYYNDKLYFVGNTKSELTGILPKSDDTVFPISPTSFQTTNKGNTDGFIAVCEHLLNVLTYSSFIGGSKYDAITNIYVSTVTDGNPNIIGVTESNDFPIQSGGSSSYHANKDVVVSGFTTGFGGLSYTRFVGTSKNDYPSDIVFDNINTYILSGYSQSDDFHLDKEASTQHHGGYDGFIHKFTTESLLLETPGDKDSYCSQNSITIKWNSQDIIQKSYKLEYTDNNIDYKDLTDILDKNSFVWSLDSAEVFQSDLYKIRVSSLSGLVSENVGNFSIIDSPGNGILSTESALENLCIGDTVKIFCNAPYKNLTYLWFVNNKQLVNNNDTLIYPITASINLEIYCKLSNGCSPDTKTNSLKVTVAKPSAINSQIADTTIIENRTLLLEADVNEATERVDWYKDDELIAGNSNSLNFESIRLQDSGSYHFKAFGKCNAVTSEKFYIDVDPDVSVSEENLYELFSKFEIADNGTEKPYLNIQSNNLVFDCVLFDNIGNRLEYLTVNSQNLSYNFNTKDHPAGIYWITVYIDNASYSRKIVLVK
jgi:hypothetical protein